MDDEISLSKFLSRYFSLGGKALSKVTHDEVKVLFPFIKRTTFENVEKNPELLYKGKVALVNDGKKTIPYFIPEVLDEEIESTEFLRQEEKTNRVDYSRHDYSSMSIYELKNLLERKFNSRRNQVGARKELESRGAIRKRKYNRNEFKKDIEEE